MKAQKHSIRFFTTASLALILIAGATAQTNAVPSVDEIINKLNAVVPSQSGEAKPGRKMRGVVLSDGSRVSADASNANGKQLSSSSVHSNMQRVEKVDPTGYSEARIQFEFGSEKLTGFSRQVLDVFASAIQSPSLKDVNFIVEGHTDGVGSDQYNLNLSRRRAEAVVRYLAGNRGISTSRLSARGKGKRELINSADPTAAENRRVAWVPLG